MAAQIIDEYAGPDDDLNDAYVTLCVHAGIAAADVVCCAHLGVHHEGQHHRHAVELLGRVSPALGRHLATLLRMKTHAGYGAASASTQECTKARRAMDRLVAAAQEAATG